MSQLKACLGVCVLARALQCVSVLGGERGVKEPKMETWRRKRTDMLPERGGPLRGWSEVWVASPNLTRSGFPVPPNAILGSRLAADCQRLGAAEGRERASSYPRLRGGFPQTEARKRGAPASRPLSA